MGAGGKGSVERPAAQKGSKQVLGDLRDAQVKAVSPDGRERRRVSGDDIIMIELD